jgi:hypothetical protein
VVVGVQLRKSAFLSARRSAAARRGRDAHDGTCPSSAWPGGARARPAGPPARRPSTCPTSIVDTRHQCRDSSMKC